MLKKCSKKRFVAVTVPEQHYCDEPISLKLYWLSELAILNMLLCLLQFKVTEFKFLSQAIHHIYLMINKTGISVLLQNFSMLDIFWNCVLACVLCLNSLISWQSLTLLPSRFVIINCTLSLIGNKDWVEQVWEVDFESEHPAWCRSRKDTLIGRYLDKATVFLRANWCAWTAKIPLTDGKGHMWASCSVQQRAIESGIFPDSHIHLGSKFMPEALGRRQGRTLPRLTTFFECDPA